MQNGSAPPAATEAPPEQSAMPEAGTPPNSAEIAQRVRQVQSGLGNLLTVLPALVDRLEWVRQQLDPAEKAPAPRPESQASPAKRQRAR